jgi:hypothetical protein
MINKIANPPSKTCQIQPPPNGAAAASTIRDPNEVSPSTSATTSPMARLR